jgi:hypothetical protein
MEVGLFGSIGEGGEIRNLGIENCHIVGDSYTGGLVGVNNYGTVSNCYKHRFSEGERANWRSGRPEFRYDE